VNAHWSAESLTKPAKVVPVLSMRQVLQSIPSQLLVWFLKTDMQNHDFAAVASAGDLLTRVPYVMTEVNVGGLFSYEGTRNDYCLDWLPHMLALGYRPHKLTGHFHAFTWDVAVKKANRYCASSTRRASAKKSQQNRRRAGEHERAEEDAYWVLNGTTVPPPCYSWSYHSGGDQSNDAHWCAEKVPRRVAPSRGLLARWFG